MRSRRKDGRGHWPAGRKRNPPCPEAVAHLRWFVRECGQRFTARILQVDQKSVNRWVSGAKRPTPANAKKILERLV